ncbi:MAG TPA: ABC transporter permease [Ktedonobacterales bacterium]|nr:ABC transporter permease [Ktedonobacterales bacterium]
MGIRSISPPKPSASALDPPSSGELHQAQASLAAAPDERGITTRPRRFSASRGLRVLSPLLLGLVLLALWQAIVQMGFVSAFELPYPLDVLRAFWNSLTHDALLSYAQTTLIESLAGCALGALVAQPLAYAIVRSRLAAHALQPYLAASQAIPAIAIAPLIGLWFGYDLLPVIVLCALIVFFPMVVSTVLGLRTLDRDVIDAARTEGAGWWALLWRIEVPLALPSILAGLRTSLTLSITGAVVGEFVVAGHGLGELLLIDYNFADSAGVFATLLMLALLATLLYGLVRLLERWLSYMEA